MRFDTFARTASGVAASVAVLAPLTACSGSGSSSPASSPSASSSSAAGPSTSGPSASSAPPTGGGAYRDGRFTERGVYGGAPSYITVSLTLDDSTITDVDVEPMPDNNATSRGYQERFAAAVPDEVVGKSIDDVEVGAVAGASGCGDGFNDAVAKIREQARAGE